MSSNEQPQAPKPDEAPELPNMHCHGRRHRWKIPFFVAGLLVVKSAVIMVLWNHLIPELFHGPELGYVQALGLSILAKLFVGFGGHHHRHFGPGMMAHHRHHWKEHWATLSPEEREKLRESLRKRWKE